jgi:hypothetical protein
MFRIKFTCFRLNSILRRIYGYLKKFSSAFIRVQTLVPDLGSLSDPDFEWCYTVFGNIHELIPADAPEPLGMVLQQ